MGNRHTAGTENNALCIALLGGVDFRAVEKPLDLGYAKLGGLLAFLAMSSGMPLRREYLAELFWPDMTPEAGRQNLRRALFNLRSSLGEFGTLLSAGRDVVTLDCHGLWMDVADFIAAAPSCIAAPNPVHCNPCIAQMEYMTELYRGEFMAGFSLPGCTDFEEWLQLQREAMHRRALAILERLSNCHEQICRYGTALPFALRYTELEPWDEEGYRRTMRLYALNGQNSAALGQYESCCRVLKKELRALPNNETRSLAESILKGEWRKEQTGATGNPPATVLPPPLTERREVTVLYCEFALPSIDDHDEAIALLLAPQMRCMEIIRQFSGYIVQAHGGGMLAYFGYPQADKNAACRAVQAGLAVTRDAASGIEIRACIHTGLIITARESTMPDMVGKTSMTAIQLRNSIAHNEVALSPQTHRLVSGQFDCISLGVQSLPGVAQPLEIFKAVREITG